MTDDAPYIIVDNQKIQPISRSPRPGPTAGDTARKQAQNFGVVDRVTLSREGLEKSKRFANAQERRPFSENRPVRSTHRSDPMLIDPPKNRP